MTDGAATFDATAFADQLAALAEAVAGPPPPPDQQLVLARQACQLVEALTESPETVPADSDSAWHGASVAGFVSLAGEQLLLTASLAPNGHVRWINATSDSGMTWYVDFVALLTETEERPEGDDSDTACRVTIAAEGDVVSVHSFTDDEEAVDNRDWQRRYRQALDDFESTVRSFQDESRQHSEAPGDAGGGAGIAPPPLPVAPEPEPEAADEPEPARTDDREAETGEAEPGDAEVEADDEAEEPEAAHEEAAAEDETEESEPAHPAEADPEQGEDEPEETDEDEHGPEEPDEPPADPDQQEESAGEDLPEDEADQEQPAQPEPDEPDQDEPEEPDQDEAEVPEPEGPDQDEVEVPEPDEPGRDETEDSESQEDAPTPEPSDEDGDDQDDSAESEPAPPPSRQDNVTPFPARRAAADQEEQEQATPPSGSPPVRRTGPPPVPSPAGDQAAAAGSSLPQDSDPQRTGKPKKWYFRSGGQKYGPFLGAELRQLFSAGGLGPGTLVRHDGMVEWQPAAEVEGLLQDTPQQQARPDADSQPRSLTVELVSGPRAGTSIEIHGTARIGRADTNEVHLADRTVSSHHATISITDQGCFIRDEKSTNGTVVNGVLIKERTRLRNGDILKLGDSALKVVIAETVPPPVQHTRMVPHAVEGDAPQPRQERRSANAARPRPAPSARDASSCPRCGEPIPERARYCSICGEKVQSERPGPPAPPTGAASGRNCHRCGAGLAAGARFCTKCGSEAPAESEVRPQNRPCGRCGAPVPESDRFCGKCGAPVAVD